MNRFVGVFLIGAVLSPSALARAQSPTPSGAAVYAERCATCHDATDTTRAPSRESLRARSIAAILAALSPTGVMAPQGAQLTAAEKQSVAAFLAPPDPSTPPATSSAPSGATAATPAAAGDPVVGGCATTPPLPQSLAPAWNGWGNDTSNARFQPSAAAGLTPADVPRLTLKWAFAFPGATTSTSQPAVAGGRVFVGSEAGGVWSLDLATGCTHWKFTTEAGVRTALTVERIPGARPAMRCFLAT